MTREKLQFLLPVVFTVGPDVNQRGGNAVNIDHSHHDANVNQDSVPIVDRGDALMKYAMLLADGENGKNVTRTQHIENIVKGIIEGETRVLVSSMVNSLLWYLKGLLNTNILKRRWKRSSRRESSLRNEYFLISKVNLTNLA